MIRGVYNFIILAARCLVYNFKKEYKSGNLPLIVPAKEDYSFGSAQYMASRINDKYNIGIISCKQIRRIYKKGSFNKGFGLLFPKVTGRYIWLSDPVDSSLSGFKASCFDLETGEICTHDKNAYDNHRVFFVHNPKD